MERVQHVTFERVNALRFEYGYEMREKTYTKMCHRILALLN